MILVKLSRNNLHPIAENPLRKRGKILRVAARATLELWALTLVAVCPLTLYFIYLFSQLKPPPPPWQSLVERRAVLNDSSGEAFWHADAGDTDSRRSEREFCERFRALSLNTSRQVICEPPASYSLPTIQLPPAEPPRKPVGTLMLAFMMCWGFLKLAPHVLEWAGNTRTLARRFTMADAESLLSRDGREPVLYLRPFIDRYAGNDILAQPESDENLIFPVVKEAGPVITIGQPGETLAPSGASRLYVDNDCDWRRTVADYFSRSRLVVISPGRSEGVIWETSEALQSCPEKIIISLVSFKAELNYSKPLSSYQLFRDAIQSSTKIDLPSNIDDSLFIYFDSDRKPRLAKPEAGKLNSWFIEAAVRDALRKLLQSKGINVSRKMPTEWYLLNAYELLLTSAALLIPIVAIIQTFVE